MSAAPQPVEPAAPLGTPEISEAAQLARERLHEEIERVRNGVEEMLDQRESANGSAYGNPNPFVTAVDTEETRRELEKLRVETRDYVKKKVRKSEKKLERSVRELEERSDELEERIDQVESEREEAEWRIHNSNEQMLDGLLDAVRSIADRLTRQPAGPAPLRQPAAPPSAARQPAAPAPAARQPASPAPAAAPAPPPKFAPPPKAPVGRVGPRPLRRGK